MSCIHIAIVGSRGYPHLEDVTALVEKIAADNPCAVIVSGGAKGVDKTAEDAANKVGLEVASYRVRKIGNEDFGIEEWYFSRLGGGKVRLMIEEPTWGNYDSALLYRNMLIAERAVRMVVFHTRYLSGTWHALDAREVMKRPIKKYGVDADRYLKAA